MNKIPCEIITGTGLGTSSSSLKQIGSLWAAEQFGLMGMKLNLNVTNGNVVVEDRPVISMEYNVPQEIKFIYNSQADSAQNAWRLAIKKIKEFPSAGSTTATVVAEDGHESTYTQKQGTNSYFAPDFVSGNPYLTFDSTNNRWTMFYPATQSQEIYDTSGNLLQRIDAAGRVTAFEYSNGQFSAITGPSGDRYEIRRDGNLWAIFLGAGSTGVKLQSYSFDDSGLTTSLPDGNFVKYEYTKVGSTYDYQRLNAITQSDGSLLNIAYTKISNQYYPNILRASGIGVSNTIRFDYSKPAQATANFSDGSKAGFAFDSQARITETTLQNGYSASSPVDTKKYAYDDSNHLQEVTYPDGNSEIDSYDYPAGSLQKTLGLLKSKTLQDGRVISNYYDTTQPLKAPLIAQSIKSSAASKDEAVTRKVYDYNYDGQGKYHLFLRYTISPEGRVSEYRCLPDGSIATKRVFIKSFIATAATLPPGAVVTLTDIQNWKNANKVNPQDVTLSGYQYDKRGQTLVTNKFANVDEWGNGFADEQMSAEYTTWDKQGGLTVNAFKQLPNQEINFPTSRNVFDLLHRVTKKTNALNEPTNVNYADAAATTITTLPNGRKEVEKRDAQGLLISHESSFGNVTRTTTYNRDVNGIVRSIVSPDGSIQYPLYDMQNRLGFMISTIGSVTQNIYNVQKRFNQIISYENAIDLTKIIPPGESSPVISLLQNQLKNPEYGPAFYRSSYKFFDVNGRLQYEVDADSYVTQSNYDKLNNPVQNIAYAAPLTSDDLATLINGGTINLIPDITRDRVKQLYYDNDNRLIGQKDPAGYVIERILDEAGREIQTIKYATPNPGLDSINNFDSARPPDLPNNSHEYNFYDARNQNILRVDAEGYITQKFYLPCGELDKSIRYATRVLKDWYKNTTTLPTPIRDNEDRVIQDQYDPLNRVIHSTDSLNKQEDTQFDVMGNTTLNATSNKKKIAPVDGDNIRINRKLYDEWDQVIAEANEIVSQQILIIENSDLPPDEKKTKIDAIWSSSSTRHIYDPNGAELYTLDPLSHKTIYYYDADMRPIITIDPTGAVIQKTLDVFGNTLVERKYYTRIDASLLATLQGGMLDSKLSSVLQSLLNDDKDSVFVSKYGKRNQLISQTDPENNISTFGFNAFKQCDKEILPVNKDTGSQGLTIIYKYEPRGLEIETTKSAGDKTIKNSKKYLNQLGKLTDIIDEIGGHTQLGIDKLGRNFETSKLIDENSYIVTETLELDAFDNVTLKTDADNVVTKIKFISQENLKEITFPNADDSKKIIVDNVFSQPIQIIDTTISGSSILKQEQFTHAPDGQAQSHTDGLGNQSTTKFDLTGKTTDEVDPSQIITKYEHNGAGGLTKKIIDANELGLQLTTITQPNALGDNEIVINPRKILTNNIFDRNRNLQKSVLDSGLNQLNSTLELTYNAQNKVTSSVQGSIAIKRLVQNRIDGFNRLFAVVKDPLGLKLTTEYYRDDAGNVIKETDPNSNIKRTYYNLLQQNRFEIKALNDSKVFAIERQYTKSGKLSLLRTYQPIDKNLIDNNTTLADLPQKFITSNYDSITLYFYDKKGREQFKIDLVYSLSKKAYEAIVEEKNYDLADRDLRTTYYANTIDASNYTNWTTASVATLVNLAKDDSKDRYVTKWYDEASEQRISMDQDGVITNKQYDKNGRPISESISPPLPSISANDHNISLDTILEKLKTIESQSRIKYFVYDACGRVRFIVKPDNSVIRKSYDANGNIIQVCKFNDPINSFSSYDDLVIKLNSLQAINPKDALTNTKFDNADHVSSITDALGNSDMFIRDDIGNTKVHTDRAGFDWTYGFDGAERMTSLTSPITTTVSVSRSDDGKLIYTKNTQTVTKQIQHDNNGNPISITEAYGLPNARVINFSYDPNNNLSSTNVPDSLVDDDSSYTPAWDNLKVLPQKSVSISTEIIYNSNGKKICELDESGLWSFYIYDSSERLIYEIQKQKILKKYSYNSFNEIIEDVVFNDSIADGFDFTAFIGNGIHLDDISIDNKNPAKINIVPSDEDRKNSYEVNRNGKVTQITKNALNFYQDGVSGTSQPTSVKRYNSFGDCIYEASLITPGKWAEKFVWVDKCGRVLAEVNENRFITQYIRDTSGRVLYKSEFENSIPTNITISNDLSIDDLINFITLNPAKDRFTKYNYDNLGNKLSETCIQVVTQKLVLDEKTNVPSVINTDKTDLSKNWSYSPTQQIISVTYEDGNSEYKYYDERGNLIGETSVTRTDPLSDPVKPITPLTIYLQDNFNKTVVKQTSPDGCALATIGKLPSFIDINKVIEEIKLTDNRGLVSLKQDEEGNLSGSTYTATKKVSRELKTVSQWQRQDSVPDDKPSPTIIPKRSDISEEKNIEDDKEESFVKVNSKSEDYKSDDDLDMVNDFSDFTTTNMSDPDYLDIKKHPTAPPKASPKASATFTKVPFLTQKKYTYDWQDRPTYLAFLRKADFEQTTYSRYNTFGEFIAESPDNINWPAIQKFDTNGNIWFSNLSGAGTISFYDLRGKESLRVQAPSVDDNLGNFDYTNILSLLSWEAARLNRTESIRDNAGNVIAHKSPIWFKDRNALPTHQYLPDRWNNNIQETDSLGNVTDFDRNFRDKLQLRTDPFVSSTNASGVDSIIRPVTQHAYSVRGFEFATVDASNNTEAHELDEAGQWISRILADGVINLRRRLDAISRIIETRDSTNQPTKFGFNNLSLVTSSTSPSGYVNKRLYDENKDLACVLDPTLYQTYYNNDVRQNCVERYLDQGDLTVSTFDRNRQLLSTRYSDNSFNLWNRDYFSYVNSFKDLDGRYYNNVFDGAKQKQRYYNDGALTWPCYRFSSPVEYYEPDTSQYPITVYDLTGSNSTTKDIRYTWSFAQNVNTTDYALDQFTQNQFNTEGMKTRFITTRISDQVLLYDVSTNWDALRRETSTSYNRYDISCFYNAINTTTKYDPISNRRLFSVWRDKIGYGATCPCSFPAIYVEYWNDYDAASRAIVSDGVLLNGSITIAANKGLSISYANDLRNFEYRINAINNLVTTSLSYTPEQFLDTSVSTSGLTAKRGYLPTGAHNRYEEIYPGHDVVVAVGANSNGYLTWQEVTDNNVIQSNSDYIPLSIGVPQTQTLYLYKDGNPIKVRIFTFEYFRPESTYRLSKTYANDGPVAEYFFDPNAILNGKYNAQDEPNLADGEVPRIFYGTTTEGYMLSKHYINNPDATQDENRDKAYYFIPNVNGEIKGGFSNECNYLDRYFHWAYHVDDDWPSGIHPEVSDITNFSPIRPIGGVDAVDPTAKDDPLGWDKQPFPNMGPQIYTVNSGETIESIAMEQCGDILYAEAIAKLNGLPSTNIPIKANHQLRLPQFVANHNKATTARPYNDFLNVVIGSLIPNSVVLPPPKPSSHHTSWFAELIKVIALGIVIAIAPELGAFALTTLGITTAGATLTAIATGVAAAIGDAVVQRLAIAAGLQTTGFSFTEVLETGVSAGTLGFIGGVATSPEQLAIQAVKIGVIQVNTQLAEMALGLRDTFDAGAVGTQVVSSIASSQISKVITSKIAVNNVARDLASNTVSNSVSSIIGSTITHTPISIQQIAVNSIGSTASNKVTASLTRNVVDSGQSIPDDEKPTTTPQTPVKQRYSSHQFVDEKISVDLRLPQIDFSNPDTMVEAKSALGTLAVQDHVKSVTGTKSPVRIMSTAKMMMFDKIIGIGIINSQVTVDRVIYQTAKNFIMGKNGENSLINEVKKAYVDPRQWASESMQSLGKQTKELAHSYGHKAGEYYTSAKKMLLYNVVEDVMAAETGMDTNQTIAKLETRIADSFKTSGKFLTRFGITSKIGGVGIEAGISATKIVEAPKETRSRVLFRESFKMSGEIGGASLAELGLASMSIFTGGTLLVATPVVTVGGAAIGGYGAEKIAERLLDSYDWIRGSL